MLTFGLYCQANEDWRREAVNRMFIMLCCIYLQCDMIYNLTYITAHYQCDDISETFIILRFMLIVKVNVETI